MKAITPETLYLILPGKVSQLALLINKNLGINLLDAIRDIYRSNTYKVLSREETKLWHYGPVALFEYYMENK